MKFKRILKFFVAVVLTVVFINGRITDVNASKPNESGHIMVFAAASTTNAVFGIKELFEKQSKGQVTLSFASSSTLAKQIARGAPANVYISANPKWMAFLEKGGHIEPGTAFSLLGNRIVLIAPFESPIDSIDIQPGLDLAAVLKDRFLAMGDPDHVPAGIYGKKALQSLGSWDGIKSKIVRAKDVRSALVFVERNETPLGVVYATDAAISGKVKVIGIFPENTHPPIVYKAGLVKGQATSLAKEFMEFLTSGSAVEIFEKYGFKVQP